MLKIAGQNSGPLSCDNYLLMVTLTAHVTESATLKSKNRIIKIQVNTLTDRNRNKTQLFKFNLISHEFDQKQPQIIINELRILNIYLASCFLFSLVYFPR